jgi:hypothetical protein
MANSMAPVYFKTTVTFNRGDTFVFGAWVCTADGARSFQRRLTMPPNPETGFVTLPEVVTDELAGKFGEISLFNHHADFELESAYNSNSTSPWATACEPTPQPSHVVPQLHERSTRGPRNPCRARTGAPSARWTSKEPVPEYNSDSDTAPGHASDSNPLSVFYSDSAYEFDFGSNPEDPESEDNTTEHPLSGLASGLVITSTPAGRFVYWPDCKPTDPISGDSCYVAYIDSLPFQEGTPLARADSYTPTEVASSESSLGNPDRQVFMAAGDTPGPSGMAQDKYLEDISADELSADAPADETAANRTLDVSVTGSATNGAGVSETTSPSATLRKLSRRSRAEYTLPPEQCLMSITVIARQAQGIRVGEVIAKLAEDAYFMRVDNRVNQPPPSRNRDNEATSRIADVGRNRTRAELPAQPNRTRANADGPSQGGNSNREVVPHRAHGGGGRDPDGGGSGDGSSNHGANRRPGGGGSRGGRDHANSHTSGAPQGGYDARQKIEELR